MTPRDALRKKLKEKQRQRTRGESRPESTPFAQDPTGALMSMGIDDPTLLQLGKDVGRNPRQAAQQLQRVLRQMSGPPIDTAAASTTCTGRSTARSERCYVEGLPSTDGLVESISDATASLSVEVLSSAERTYADDGAPEGLPPTDGLQQDR